MIQTRPFEFMTRFTRQTQWIEGKGIFLWLAFFFIEVGAGMLFVSALVSSLWAVNSLWAMFIGWLICIVLGGGFHLLYLGHPFRFWRAFLRPQSSWLSRGIIFLSCFIVFGAIHMAVSFWAAPNLGLLVIAEIFAFLTTIYGGFAMNYCNGIGLWDTALLPVLYVVAGFWGGAELSMGVVLATGAVSVAGHAIEEIIRILLAAFIIIVPAYLVSVRYSTAAGATAVSNMATGKWWPLLWFVVILLGIGAPLGAVIYSFNVGLTATPVSLLSISIFFELLGDLMLRLLLLKNGFYNPLTPISDVPSV